MDNVYWLGQDGNIWFRSGDNTQNMGRPVPGSATQAPLRHGLNPGGFDAERGSAEARLIEDWNKPRQQASQAPTNPNAGGGGGGSNPLTAAAIQENLKGLGSLDTELSGMYRGIDDSYNDLLARYASETARSRRDYDENSAINAQNQERGTQAALSAAAQGRRGLFGVLSSLGALGGTGRELADGAVRDTANADLGGVQENFNTNARNLNRSWEDYQEEDERRKVELARQRDTQRNAAEREILGRRQTTLQKLADLYSQSGNNAEARSRLSQAGDLYDQIAQKSHVPLAPMSYSSAKFNPGELNTYAAGTGDMTVSTSSGNNSGVGAAGSLNSLTASRRRDDEERL